MSNTAPAAFVGRLAHHQAIGESGGLAAAAEALGVNHSTSSRRLATVEQTLGVVLFDRRRSGYVPTGARNDMIALAVRVEKDIHHMVRRVSGGVQGHKGDLRVTTSDALLLDFLTPIIADFQAANPEIRIEVIVGSQARRVVRNFAPLIPQKCTLPVRRCTPRIPVRR